MPAEMVEDNTRGGTPHTGTHVIEQKVYGYGDRAFLQVIVTHDAVADNVHDEKIERENS